MRDKLIELICEGTQKTEICTTATYMDCEPCRGDCGYCTILADHLIANGVTISKWIPVSERLPESGIHVLVTVKMDGAYCVGQYVCDAFYADKYSQSISGYSVECACEYCEEDDEYYLEKGWYEVIKNWDDYNSISILDTVTHWMPLPEPPKGE